MRISNRQRTALSGAIGVALAGPNLVWATTRTWTGSSSFNSNWANGINWQSGSPSQGDALTFRGTLRTANTQDFSPIFSTGSISFGGGAGVTGTFQISGNPIALSATGQITNASLSLQVFRNEVQLSGAASFTGGYVSYPAAMVFLNVSGPGNLTIDASGAMGGANAVVITTASYAGTTTVRSGVLRIGGQFNLSSGSEYYTGQTTNQGDYEVLPGATLSGTGQIGLASGHRVHLAGGKISPSAGSGLGIEEDGGHRLTIDGHLVFEAGSEFESRMYSAGLGQPTSRIFVNGTLDLSAANDRIHLLEDFGHYRNNLLAATYLNRLGAYDVIDLPTGYQLLYTSAENSGPGEIWFVVPEPTATTLLPAALATLQLRRRRQV